MSMLMHSTNSSFDKLLIAEAERFHQGGMKWEGLETPSKIFEKVKPVLGEIFVLFLGSKEWVSRGIPGNFDFLWHDWENLNVQYFSTLSSCNASKRPIVSPGPRTRVHGARQYHRWYLFIIFWAWSDKNRWIFESNWPLSKCLDFF